MVEIADATQLQELEPELFARLHAVSFGSIGRQDAYSYLASGAWTYEHPEPDKSVRAAVHYGPDGKPDGYVSYKFTGWDAPATVAVRDLLATTDQAYLALWKYLGSIDLVQRVRWNRAPVQDPLEWALADKRGYQVKSMEDSLWLRILDTAAALDESAPADLEVGAAELASLYLSGVPARTLAAAGTVDELSAGAAARFDALFGAPMLPHSRTDF